MARSGKSRAQRRREERQPDEPAGRRWLRWGGALLAVAVITLVTADALGAFKSTAYTAVPHGSHDHYVPDRCGEDAARTGEFPTQPPDKGERITCDGQVISE
jgi:hypothetical protein